MNRSNSKKPTLRVLVDNQPLDDEKAREVWVEFSRYMDEHEGDLAGFAKKRGWAKVLPEHRRGQAVLIVKTLPQGG